MLVLYLIFLVCIEPFVTARAAPPRVQVRRGTNLPYQSQRNDDDESIDNDVNVNNANATPLRDYRCSFTLIIPPFLDRLLQCCGSGSGIRCLLTSGSGMGRKARSGSGIRNTGLLCFYRFLTSVGSWVSTVTGVFLVSFVQLLLCEYFFSVTYQYRYLWILCGAITLSVS
jgi:hypothetical protein